RSCGRRRAPTARTSGSDLLARWLVHLPALLREPRQLPQLALDPLQFRRHDRHVDDDQDQEDDVGAGDVLAGLVERQGGGAGEQRRHRLARGAPRGPPPAAGASSARRSRFSCPAALFAVSSNLTRVTQSRAMVSRQARKVSIIDPGRPPLAVAKTRGWTR